MSQLPVYVHADPDYRPRFVGTIVRKGRMGGKSCVRACRKLYGGGIVFGNLSAIATYFLQIKSERTDEEIYQNFRQKI